MASRGIECPICGQVCPPREHDKAYPFCSHRCQMVDLSRWLDEEYRIPGDPADTADTLAADGVPPRRTDD